MTLFLWIAAIASLAIGIASLVIGLQLKKPHHIVDHAEFAFLPPVVKRAYIKSVDIIVPELKAVTMAYWNAPGGSDDFKESEVVAAAQEVADMIKQARTSMSPTSVAMTMRPVAKITKIAKIAKIATPDNFAMPANFATWG